MYSFLSRERENVLRGRGTSKKKKLNKTKITKKFNKKIESDLPIGRGTKEGIGVMFKEKHSRQRVDLERECVWDTNRERERVKKNQNQRERMGKKAQRLDQNQFVFATINCK